MSESSHERILELASKRGVIRARDVARRGLPTVTLTRLVRAGALERVARGLYALPSAPASEHASFAEVAPLAPKAVV
ncbi:MAG: type IV toxin-antitoxin system AbiEi family antitoxin domain-containing protein, partial [Actinomycetota bacterium]